MRNPKISQAVWRRRERPTEVKQGPSSLLLRATTVAAAAGLLVPGAGLTQDLFTPAPETSNPSCTGHGHASDPVANAQAGRYVDVQTLSSSKRKALADAYVRWIAEIDMVPTHVAWHGSNGPGGTQGPGSGEAFLAFHAEMAADFKAEAVRQGILTSSESLPTWDPSRPLPKEFHFEGMQRATAPAPPPFLGLEADPGGMSFLLTLADGTQREIRSLHDIESPDELGRVWGDSSAHASLHSSLGGAMTDYEAVKLPPFLLIHGGLLEANRTLWLEATENGRAWQAAHPTGWSQEADVTHSSHHR